MIFWLRLRAAVERALHPGYGSCYRCRRPWACVDPHHTDYSPSGGCFPLCESCWAALGSPAARLPFYERLMASWAEEGCAAGAEKETLILVAVKEGK